MNKVQEGRHFAFMRITFERKLNRQVSEQTWIPSIRTYRKRIRSKQCYSYFPDFHKQDNNLDTLSLKHRSRYLDKIGFGNQPFLVYRHFNDAHPHLHVVTISIQLNARCIPA